MKHLVALGLVAAFGSAQAVVLFSNGPVVDGSGLSVLNSPASTPADSTLGFGSNASFALADNFTVTGPGWSVESLDFYGYQTSAVGFTFTSATWSLRSGTDVNTATILASGTTPVTSGGVVGFRVTSTTLTNTTRAIWTINADIPDIVLPAGNYFVTWALAGTSASGPFVPPVLGSVGTGNALQAPVGTGVFAPLLMGVTAPAVAINPVEVPFAVQGSLVPEPSTIALMLAGGMAVVGAARRRRAD